MNKIVDEIIPVWAVAIFIILACLNILIQFDMLPGGKRKPFTFKPSGRPVRINTSDGKQVPIRKTTWDRFREVTIAESNKIKHKIFIPKSLTPQPSNFAAYIAGDTRHNTLDIPIDIAGRYVDWRGGGYPMLEQEKRNSELRRQNYLLQRRVDRLVEPAEDFYNQEVDNVDRIAEIIGKLNASARESAGEMKRRG